MAGKALYCDVAKNKGLAISDRRRQKPGYPGLARTILPWVKCEFSVCVIDEAHIARTPRGRLYVGLSEMMHVSQARILATATPLQHTPKVRQKLPNSHSSHEEMVN